MQQAYPEPEQLDDVPPFDGGTETAVELLVRNQAVDNTISVEDVRTRMEEQYPLAVPAFEQALADPGIDRYPLRRGFEFYHTYKEDISVERARQYLNLSQDAFIVTAFGKFRNREEIRMVLGAFRAWDEEHKMLLAPRLYPFSRRNSYGRNIIKRWISKAGYYLLMPLLNRMYKLQAGANDELIDNCDLPYYMAASDVIIIQRKDILNSGNVPLAFLNHKVVVGPKVGNIGELLSETGNPTFDPDDKKDILRALEEARRLAAWGQGEVNYAYGMENMSIRKVGQAYAQTYKQAING